MKTHDSQSCRSLKTAQRRRWLKLGLAVLILCILAAGFSAWRIRRLSRLKPPPPEDESIRVITDRFERELEEVFRKWETR